MAKKTAKSKVDYQAMPPQPMEGQVTDRQAQFRTLTRSAPAERGSERAFLASKLTMLRTLPGLSEEERAEGEAMLARRFGTKTFEALKKKTGPVPGGVGYGMFYEGAFRTAFARGTSLYYEIICPHQPGGNVNTWLYLTATNRAQKGVEAFVAYRGQNDTRFKVFDWARSDQWQTNIPFANLTSYLRSTVAHGWGLEQHVRDRAEPLAQRGPAAQPGSQSVGPGLPVRLRLDDGRAAGRLGGQLGRNRRDVPKQLFEHQIFGISEHHVDGAQRRRPMGQLGRPHRGPEYDP